MRKLTHPEIVDRQRSRTRKAKLPLHIVLNNIRSLYNVGSIFRTADGVGVSKIWICGITGRPPHPQIAKTALGAEDSILWEYQEDIIGVVKDLKAQGFQIVACEQIDQSVFHDEFIPSEPVCLIIGNEIDGVSPDLLDLCDQAVEVHMAGIKNSLNVSVAFGIIAYHVRKILIEKRRRPQ